MAAAISLGWAARPSGAKIRVSIGNSGWAFDTCAVSVKPGHTQFTRMLRGPSSIAAPRVAEITAALVMEYWIKNGEFRRPATEAVFTMEPPAVIRAAASLMPNNMLTAFS